MPSPEKRGDGDDGDEGARAPQARLKVVDRAQLLFRTVDVERLIPEEHPARAIWEFVGRLDLSGYTDQVRSVAGGAGRPAFDPQLLVSLWVYSYSQAVSSARAVERLCEYHPAYQWLTGMQSISAHTLSDFRVTHEEILNELFVEALGVLTADGLITLERVMLDGTRCARTLRRVDFAASRRSKNVWSRRERRSRLSTPRRRRNRAGRCRQQNNAPGERNRSV